MSRSVPPELAHVPDSDSPVRIVVGWDVANTEAVELAAWLGRSMPVAVQVVAGVHSPLVRTLTKGSKKRKKRLREATEAFRSRVVKTLDEHLPRSQWSADVARLVDQTDTVRSLYDTAADFDADLIVLGSRAKSPKGRFRPTTLADELMSSSPVPLALAPRGVKLSKKGITRINYAIVDSDHAAEQDFAGLRYATSLACWLRLPLRIIAFSSVDYGDQPAEWNEAVLGMLDRARDDAWSTAAELIPDRLEQFDVHSSVSAAKSWKRAIDSVKWKKGDLLCLGSQPSGQLKSVIVGTREGEFVRFASVPVIICPRVES